MDEGLDRQKSHAEEQVRAHEDRQQAKKSQNQEAVREHLRGSIPQTEASSSADAHTGRNYIPPDDDRYSSGDKKVKGKTKGSRANKKQISELKKMNEEMKKSIEETIDKPDEPMREESPVVAKKEKEKHVMKNL